MAPRPKRQRSSRDSTRQPKPPTDAARGANGPARAQRTLRLRNLDTDTPLADLRTALYLAASLYGQVTAINTLRAPKLRGQAYVAFATAGSARLALAKLPGLELFGKPVVAEWARAESHRAEWAAA